MKCQICGKNEAVEEMHLNINGKVSMMSVCPECANKVAGSLFKTGGSIYESAGLGNLASALYGLAGAPSQSSAGPEILKAVSKCPLCGMTYDEFVSKGKLGCGECYSAFHDRLLRPLKQIHGTYEHVGKIPERGGGELKNSRRLDKLKMSLDKAVREQEFEKAAEIRDEIKAIKGEK